MIGMMNDCILYKLQLTHDECFFFNVSTVIKHPSASLHLATEKLCFEKDCFFSY